MNAQTLERAIRAKCLDCCGGLRNEVRDCKLSYCPLWPYRGAGAEGAKSASSSGFPMREKAQGCDGELCGQMNINDIVGRR